MPYVGGRFPRNVSTLEFLEQTIITPLIIIVSFFALLIVSGTINSLRSQLATKGHTVQKAQVSNAIKRCEALRESTKGHHAGNWFIEVSDKGVVIECVQQGYRVPR
jgi:predicted Holliday junction resolvase-like endonuclease